MDKNFQEKFFSHPKSQQIPIGYQCKAVEIFEEIMEEMQKERQQRAAAARKSLENIKNP